MKVLKEFKEFINKGNVVDLAVAVVIGGAFGKIVSAIVADLVMPLVNAVIPQGDWRKWEVSPLHFRVGDFLGTLVDFTIVAFVVFIVMVKVVGTVNRKTAAPETKAVPRVPRDGAQGGAALPRLHQRADRARAGAARRARVRAGQPDRSRSPSPRRSGPVRRRPRPSNGRPP